MSSEHMLALMQVVLAALAGLLTLALARALRRRGTSEWVLSWFALAAYVGFGSVHLSPDGGVLARTVNVVARVLEVSAGSLQVGMLVAVAWIYDRVRPLPRAAFSSLLLVSIGLGIGQAMMFGGETWLVLESAVGRVAVHSFLTAIGLPITGVWLLLAARPRVTIARGVLATVYVIIGAVSLLKIAYVMGLISALPPAITPELVGLMDVARYTALGLAASLILVEKLEAKASTSAEDAARALEAKDLSDSWFRTLVENAQEIVLVVDHVGRCLYASQSITRTAGWRASDLVGQDVFQFVFADDLEHVRHEFGKLVSGAPDPIPAAFRIRKLDGVPVTVESTGVRLPQTHGAGEDATFIVIARDVTARHVAEKRERLLAQQLYRSQKTESLGRLAGGVAHDFNNLLTVIYGHASVARKLLGNDHPAVADLSEVEGAARRAGALTRQLLVYSRRQVTERTPLDLDRIVADLSRMLLRIVGETIQFETRLGASGAFVQADRGQLEQVLVNLVVNARDAMPEGGRLVVETGCVIVSGQACVPSDLAHGSHASITVTDSGRGIPSEFRDLVFEPFFTTKAPQGGTGLGLATSEGIIQLHQGRIWFESSRRGTSFHVWLPLATPLVSEIPAAGTEQPRVGPERVLLVEDEAGVRHVVARALREHGYQVVDVGDPLAARRTAAEEHFEVLVTDVVMPRLSGLALADQISAVQPRIKVLFISGYSQESEEVGAASRLAGHRFLAKPFDPEELAVAVGELVANPHR